MRRIALVGIVTLAIPVYAQQPISEAEKIMREKEIDHVCCKLPPTENSRKVEALSQQARALIKQGKILEAREVLKSSIDLGTDPAGRAAVAEAMYVMAETYDPNALAEWGITDAALVDIPQARIFYSKAFAGNVPYAAARIRALQNK